MGAFSGTTPVGREMLERKRDALLLGPKNKLFLERELFYALSPVFVFQPWMNLFLPSS